MCFAEVRNPLFPLTTKLYAPEFTFVMTSSFSFMKRKREQMATTELYDTLEVPKTASDEEIKKAYRYVSQIQFRSAEPYAYC